MALMRGGNSFVVDEPMSHEEASASDSCNPPYSGGRGSVFKWEVRTTCDGIPLYAWLSLPTHPVYKRKPRATLILIHGLNDNSSRYDVVEKAAHERGFAVAAFDLRGQGQSGGARGDAIPADVALAEASIPPPPPVDVGAPPRPSTWARTRRQQEAKALDARRKRAPPDASFLPLLASDMREFLNDTAALLRSVLPKADDDDDDGRLPPWLVFCHSFGCLAFIDAIRHAEYGIADAFPFVACVLNAPLVRPSIGFASKFLLKNVLQYTAPGFPLPMPDTAAYAIAKRHLTSDEDTRRAYASDEFRARVSTPRLWLAVDEAGKRLLEDVRVNGSLWLTRSSPAEQHRPLMRVKLAGRESLCRPGTDVAVAEAVAEVRNVGEHNDDECTSAVAVDQCVRYMGLQHEDMHIPSTTAAARCVTEDMNWLEACLAAARLSDEVEDGED